MLKGVRGNLDGQRRPGVRGRISELYDWLDGIEDRLDQKQKQRNGVSSPHLPPLFLFVLSYSLEGEQLPSL